MDNYYFEEYNSVVYKLFDIFQLSMPMPAYMEWIWKWRD